MADPWRIKVADVVITSGPTEFRIYQQNDRGCADIDAAGTWERQPDSVDCWVEARIVREQDYAPVAGDSGRWTRVDDRADGSWRHTLRDVPAGGLYAVQTRLRFKMPDGAIGGRLCHVIHHLGVGDLWIIAGQSNASGTGRGMAEDGPELGVHVLKNEERWDVAAHPLNDPSLTDHPNRDGGPGTSPYLAMARRLRRELGYPIGLVQTARGGSALREWHVEEDPAARLWHNLLDCVRRAGGRVRGMAWYQGCSDGGNTCSLDLSERYAERFARFIELVRAEIGDFAVIVTQLNRWTDVTLPPHVDRGWSLVRDAQRRVGERVPRAWCIPALDAGLSDGIHNSSAGNVVLGERIARAALATVYGRPLLWRSPDVRRAVRADGGKTITLEFDHVASQLMFVGVGRVEFRVEDGRGLVTVTQSRPDATKVHLELERPLEGKATVSGAWGINPQWTLKDMETNLPALAFCELAVEQESR